ncbi:MAG: lysoplasmalogenase family protein [Eubacterium sp.]
MTKKDNFILGAYVGLELILFLTIKVSEQFSVQRPLDIIRYSVIVCNFLMITYLYLKYGRYLNSRENLIPLAFLFTLTADTFLCLINGIYIMGYFFFFVVESVYMFYIGLTRRSVSARIILYGALLFALWYTKMLTFTYAIAMANMAQLTVNVFCAWIKKSQIKSRETLLFALGITLFFGCDFSILIRTIVTMPPIHSIAVFTVWTCYVPAQVFLLFSYVEKIRHAELQSIEIP